MQKIEKAKSSGAVHTHTHKTFYRINSTANKNNNIEKVKRIKTVNNDKTKTYEKQIGY